MRAMTVGTIEAGFTRQTSWRGLLAAALLPVPLLVVLGLIASPELDPGTGNPLDHFLIVGAVALLALTLASVLAVG